MEVPFGSLRDTNLGSILEAFGVPVGSLGASNRGKKGVWKLVQKFACFGGTPPAARHPARGLARP